MSDLPARRLSFLDNPPGAVQPSRRDVMGWVALAAGTVGASGMLAACGTGSGGQTMPHHHHPQAVQRQGSLPDSLRALAGDVQQLGLQIAQSELPAGRTRFAFGLSDENNRLIEGLSPQVWLAKDQTGRARGPFPARWLRMTGYGRTKDRSPRSDVTGYYVAEVDLPEPGNWRALALVEVASQRAAANGSIPVRPRVVAQAGTKARSAPTPVATSPSNLPQICTRNPPCPLHYISFDQALASGKPTVLTLATPLLCPSRMCGPVVDEQLLAFQKFGRSKANFIHLEIYPQRDYNKPAPLFKMWGFQSEPYMLVIDRTGVIRGYFGDGPVAAAEIEAALQPLLS